MNIDQVLKKHSVVGVVGNRSTAKTSMVLSFYKQLHTTYPNLNLAVMGVNEELAPILNQLNIKILQSKMDILDLRMKDTIIFVDEFALFFDSQGRSKQQGKLMRFFDRIEHQNCKFIIGTAREGYFNKFMCSRITAFFVKQIEYEALVNGTWLKERVRAIASSSDYRLVANKPEYYYVTAGDDLTSKHTFAYNQEFDTKAKNVDLFCKTSQKHKKVGKKLE